MPVKDLIACIKNKTSKEVKEVAQGLIYRDFITVGLFLAKMTIKSQTKAQTTEHIVPDNWIYIQEPDVKIWKTPSLQQLEPVYGQGPRLRMDRLEYFCDEGDDLWTKTDPAFTSFAINELVKIRPD